MRKCPWFCGLYCDTHQEACQRPHEKTPQEPNIAVGTGRVVGGYLRSPQQRIEVSAKRLRATSKTPDLLFIRLMKAGATSRTADRIGYSAARRGNALRLPGKYVIASKRGNSSSEQCRSEERVEKRKVHKLPEGKYNVAMINFPLKTPK